MEYFQNGRWGVVSAVVPSKIEGGSNSTVAALFPNAENQRNDLWGECDTGCGAVPVADPEDQLSHARDDPSDSVLRREGAKS
jgi:hypothetical protein